MTQEEKLSFYQSAEQKGMTVAQVADELCISESSVRQYCYKHKITLRKIGNVGRSKRCIKSR